MEREIGDPRVLQWRGLPVSTSDLVFKEMGPSWDSGFGPKATPIKTQVTRQVEERAYKGIYLEKSQVG